jgi:hypothetical protein
MFLQPSLLRRIENEGAVDRFRARQTSVVNGLMSQARLNRLVEFEALADRPSDVYTLADLMSDLRAGIWGELSQSSVRVNVYRRNLQRAFLAAADARLNPSEAALTRANNPAPNPATSDVRGCCAPSCRTSTDWRSRRSAAPATPMTRVHLRDVRTEIARVLDADALTALTLPCAVPAQFEAGARRSRAPASFFPVDGRESALR